MKTIHLTKKLVLFFSIAFLLNACKKEQSVSPENEIANNFMEQRSAGALPDDPGAVGRVPMIVSADFLANHSSINSSFLLEPLHRGKPIKIAGDLTLPIISITSPSNGASVSGTITVSVSATDNVGVKSVSLSIDGGAIVNTNGTAPFTNSWNSGTVANGIHTLTVTAIDAAGNKGIASIQVTVNNVAPGDVTAPTVGLTSPADQSSVTGTITVSMNATDNVGVSSVSISIDNTVVSTSTSYSWNTSNSPSGVHIVTATAKDAAGNQGTKSVTVTINTVVVEPPTTTGVSLIMPPVGDQAGEGSCNAFAVGYTARSAEQYYRTGATSYSNSTNIFSPEFLYNQIKATSDCNSGSNIQVALDFMMTKGICTYQSMPYSSIDGCSLLPTIAQSNEALNYKISNYSKIFNTDRTAIKAMISQKHPLMVVVLADNSFINAKTGFIWKTFSGSGNLPHGIVICGFDDSKNAYKIMNSWGTSWGDGGFSWIDYDFFLTRAGTYCFVIN